jgi:hypothetical protein
MAKGTETPGGHGSNISQSENANFHDSNTARNQYAIAASGFAIAHTSDGKKAVSK